MRFDLNEFGTLVFNEKAMQEYLPGPIYDRWKNTTDKKEGLDRFSADAIAHAMKTWAISKGCTHYTHWFQPMTGSTAEKHDAFLDKDTNGLPIERFSGKALIKGEPDASSFPSGGLRATFEARGYTYWDCTSYAFIQDDVLCIPSVFVSYTGESLDKKAPLLRSIEALDKSATRVVNLLGDKQVRSVHPVVGLEQEYFLILNKDYEQRLDLKLTGRTLFGRQAPKSQELGDHYFGSIPNQVQLFMDDVNRQLWKLGIYSKTEHNEVAPNQFEICPIFCECNVAVDQNQIIMSVLKNVALKHGMTCLLHEKPFKGINGSGKHNNYSLVCDDGQNLFTPGDKPIENIRFLVFLSAFIKAVDEYASLLRMAASSGGAGNDHRLGASEAPPAIISIYLGQFLEDTLDNLLHSGKTKTVDENNYIIPPVSTLSYIPRDNTDRNRTSPIAFTGNKFEFRMLGSSMSASVVNTVLNTALAKELDEFSAQLEGIKYIDDIRKKALELCKDILAKHSRILFSGDGYSSQWVEEAHRRGLPHLKSGVDSFEYFISKDSIELFEQYHIYTQKEMFSRTDILFSQYEKTMEIEARTALHMITRHFLPKMIESYHDHCETLSYAANLNVPKYLTHRIDQLATWIDQLNDASEDLRGKLKQVMDNSSNAKESAFLAHKTLVPALAHVREIVDEYEKNSGKKYYGLPTYDDILFSLN